VTAISIEARLNLSIGFNPITDTITDPRQATLHFKNTRNPDFTCTALLLDDNAAGVSCHHLDWQQRGQFEQVAIV